MSEVAVDKGTEEDVDDTDEGLGAQHSLPEIPWVAHLSEESNKENSTTIGVNHVVDAVELTSKAIGLLLVRIWWGTNECLDGLNDVDERRLDDDFVVRSPVGNCDHDHDEADNVQPHRRISQPTQALQRSDHSQNHTDHHEDDHAGDEADALVGQLSNGLSTCKNQHGHSHELLERLGDVDEVTGFLAVYTEEGIAVRQERVSGRVESQEHTPQNPAREGSSDTEDQVEGYTGTVADTGKDESRLNAG